MKLDPSFKFVLTKDQQEKLLEMAKWTFEDLEVTSNHYETFTVKLKKDNSSTWEFINHLTLLLFHIPMKLGMDVVICDPQNPNVLFDQIYEKYCIYNDIPEKAVRKSKYKNSIEYDDECLYMI